MKRRLRLVRGDESRPGNSLHFPVMPAHKPDIAVEVHGLVGFVDSDT